MALQEQDARPGILQDVSNLLRGQPDVERQQDGARLDDAVVGLQQAVTVGAQESDAVAGLNASLSQRACKLAHALGELAIGEPLFPAHHGGPLWKLLYGVAKKTNRCQRNVHGELRLG